LCYTADTPAGSSTDGQKKDPSSASAKTPSKPSQSGYTWSKPSTTPKIVSIVQFPRDNLSFEKNGVTYFREFLWFEPLPDNKVKVTMGEEERTLTATATSNLIHCYLTRPIDSLRTFGFALTFLKVTDEIEVVDVCAKKATPQLLQVLKDRPFDELIKEIYFYSSALGLPAAIPAGTLFWGTSSLSELGSLLKARWIPLQVSALTHPL
jgi:hypothetical protein